MITITPISVAAGTTAYAAVTFEEQFCRAIPASANVSVTVIPQIGTLTVEGGITTVPVTCLITVTYPVCANGCTRSYQFTETGIVGVTGEATAISVAASNTASTLKNIKCCKAFGIAINTLFTITSTAAA